MSNTLLETCGKTGRWAAVPGTQSRLGGLRCLLPKHSEEQQEGELVDLPGKGEVRVSRAEAILDFLYVGEAIVEKAHLDEFLAVASELKIAGLMRQKTEKDENILEKKT